MPYGKRSGTGWATQRREAAVTAAVVARVRSWWSRWKAGRWRGGGGGAGLVERDGAGWRMAAATGSCL